MFEWNIESLELKKEYNNHLPRYGKHVFSCETKTSREDKIDFLDRMQNGKMSYLLDLIEKYNQHCDEFPKDRWGEPKTVSLKAWLKKNDPKKMIDIDFRYGRFYFIGLDRYIQRSNKRGDYDVYDDLVDELFNRQLHECKREEDKYFKKHDEYEILKEKFRNRKYGTTFGVNISECSDGRISVYKENEDASTAIWNNDDIRDITIDELKELLDKYDQLDKLVKKLTAETHIVY